MSTPRLGPGKHAAHREILQRVYGKPPVDVPDHLKEVVARLARLEEPEMPLDAEGHVSRMIRRALEKFTSR